MLDLLSIIIIIRTYSNGDKKLAQIYWYKYYVIIHPFVGMGCFFSPSLIQVRSTHCVFTFSYRANSWRIFQ